MHCIIASVAVGTRTGSGDAEFPPTLPDNNTLTALLGQIYMLYVHGQCCCFHQLPNQIHVLARLAALMLSITSNAT